MAVYKQPKSKYWWYKFVWNGKPVRESTKQTNMRIAEQMEAARRTQLAKGEVGIRDMARIPKLAEFAEERSTLCEGDICWQTQDARLLRKWSEQSSCL